jgi:hypothetical protein
MPTRLALEAAMGPMLEQRSPLRLDRAARTLSIADREVRLARRTSNDRIIGHYLRLVHEARDLSPRSRFAIRAQDLAVLSNELVVTVPLLRSALHQAMDLRIRAARPRRGRPLLPLLGFAAALGAAGAVRWIADRVDTTGTPGASSEGASAQSPPVFPLSARWETVLVGGTPTAKGAGALMLITYPWQEQLEDWTIEFKPEREGLLGYAFFQDRRVEVYIRPAQSTRDVAAVVAHELGHAIDVSTFSDRDRDRWLQARGIGQISWWPGTNGSDFASGAGDWAEAFATWLMADESLSEVAGAPTPDQLELVAILAQP